MQRKPGKVIPKNRGMTGREEGKGRDWDEGEGGMGRRNERGKKIIYERKCIAFLWTS